MPPTSGATTQDILNFSNHGSTPAPDSRTPCCKLDVRRCDAGWLVASRVPAPGRLHAGRDSYAVIGPGYSHKIPRLLYVMLRILVGRPSLSTQAQNSPMAFLGRAESAEAMVSSWRGTSADGLGSRCGLSSNEHLFRTSPQAEGPAREHRVYYQKRKVYIGSCSDAHDVLAKNQGLSQASTKLLLLACSGWVAPRQTLNLTKSCPAAGTGAYHLPWFCL